MVRQTPEKQQAMKVTKYLVIALVIVAILASIAWVLRDTIIQRISGPILQQYGLMVTGVSLDALATSNATISYLELEHENGTTITIDELTLPIGKSRTGTQVFTAGKVTIAVASASGSEPLALAQLIDQILLLPDSLPNTVVNVTQLSIAPYPTIHELRWVSTENKQTLTASVDSVDLSVEIIRTEQAIHEGVVSVRDAFANVAEQSVTASIRQTDTGISLSGASALDLPALASIATSIAVSFGITPAGVEVRTGSAELEFDAEIPYDASQTASIKAQFTPSTPWQFVYASRPGVVTSISMESSSPVEFETTFPQLEWSGNQQQALLRVSHGLWSDIPVSLSNLSCETGPACFMDIDVAVGATDLAFATASRLALSAAQDIVFRDDGLWVHVHPGAELVVTELSGPDVALGRLDVRLISGATLELADTGWQFSAASLDADIQSLSLDENLAITAPVSLRNIVVSESDQALSATVVVDSPSSQATWGDRVIALPGFKGDVSLQGANMLVALATVGLQDGKEATIQARHNLASGTGQLSIQDIALSFDSQGLSDRVSPWSYDWDISAGTFSGKLQLNWEKPDSDWQLDGASSIQMTDLAGAYADTAFAGLSTSLQANYDPATGLTTEPAKIAIDLIEVGLPIENITADYTLNPNALSVAVENLRMTAFGGVIQADPFSYQLGRDRNALVLRAESIELPELLTLKEFESIEISGSIAAELPVIIEGNAVTIVNGRLTGEAPGGVIRYLPGIAPDDAGASSIDLVTRALSNFEYEILTAELDYSKDGDLTLQMQLTGRNPDMESSRPIVLNLGIENNIPQMLRSLQAARAVEEILERRLAQ